MATIDPLLRAVLQARADALVLRPGQRPSLRRGKTEKEFTRQVLDAQALRRLLKEVAPPGTVPPPGVAEAFEFEVPLDDNQRFRFQGVPDADGLTVVVWPVPRDEATPEGNPAGSTPAGRTAPTTGPVAADAGPAEKGSEAAGVNPAAAASEPPRPVESLEELLERMVQTGASDLHLSAGQTPRFRLDGEMTPLTDLEAPASALVERLLRPILPQRNAEELAESSDTDFAWELPGRARFRVNVFRDRHGLGTVLRQIPHEIPSFEKLGLPAALRPLTHFAKGLVLITGPTGSGKSTTLAALLDLINRDRREHIVTIEDPIEFVHPSKGCLVNQREVGVHTHSFKSALRAALREDPDIVLVGEMRDLETISIAIETAETGHLVLGTLHTTTAPSTVQRLVDQFPGDRQGQIRMMLADSLRAVVAQTLLKRVGGGRVGAYEILICTPAISNLVREGKVFQIASAMQTGRQLGMRQLNDDLARLVKEKVVEPEEAWRKAADKDGLVARLNAAGIRFEPPGADDPQ